MSASLFPFFPDISENEVGIELFGRVVSVAPGDQQCIIREYGTGYLYPVFRQFTDHRVFCELKEGTNVLFRLTNQTPRVVSISIFG